MIALIGRNSDSSAERLKLFPTERVTVVYYPNLRNDQTGKEFGDSLGEKLLN